MRRKRSYGGGAFKWYYWHTITTTLQARLRAIVRGQPYRVFLLHNTSSGTANQPPAFCDFEKKKIGVNPEAFIEVFEKKRGIPADQIDEANYQAARALLEHEAAHVNYSSAQVCFRVGKFPLWRHVTNLLEDVRVENIISHGSNVSKTLIDLLLGVARELYEAPKKVTEEDPEYILHLILRWRIGLPDVKLTDPDATLRWEHVLPLCEEAKWALTMARVAEIADEILAYLGIGRGKSMTELQQEFEKELREMLDKLQGEKSGKENKPQKNPLTAPDGVKQQEAGSGGSGEGDAKKSNDDNKPARQNDSSDGKGGSENGDTDDDHSDGGKDACGDAGHDDGEGDGNPEDDRGGESGSENYPSSGDSGQDGESGEGNPGSDTSGDAGGDSGDLEDAPEGGSEGGAAGDSQDMGKDQGGSDSAGTADTPRDDAPDSSDSQGGGHGSGGNEAGEQDGSGTDSDETSTSPESTVGDSNDAGTGTGDGDGSDGAGAAGDRDRKDSVSGSGTGSGDSLPGHEEGEPAQDVPGGAGGMAPGEDGSSPTGDSAGDTEAGEADKPQRSRGSRGAGKGPGPTSPTPPPNLKELLVRAKSVSGDTLERAMPKVDEEDMTCMPLGTSGGWGGSEAPIYGQPYEHYLEYALPIAAEIKKELRTENPRAFEGPYMYGRRLKARYDMRDEERPFARKQVVGKDMPTMALVLIIDRSSSLSTEMMEFEKIAAMGMVIACEDLRIPLAIYLVEGANELKRFNEHGPQVLAKLAGLTPVGGTETTPAINRAISELRKRPEKMRQLVFFHDGEPNGSCIPHFISERQALRGGMAMFGIYVVAEGEDVETCREYLDQKLEGLFGPKRFAICKASEVAKHWTTFIQGKRRALAR